MTQSNFSSGPDANGLFGSFGGRYVAETLMPLVLDLNREYEAAKIDPEFQEKLAYFQRDYIGRPNPLYFAERLTEFCGGAKIYFKREELNHTGAHKINNCIGQVLLALRMGKKRLIAETGAGMHGVTPTVTAPCISIQRSIVCLPMRKLTCSKSSITESSSPVMLSTTPPQIVTVISRSNVVKKPPCDKTRRKR